MVPRISTVALANPRHNAKEGERIVIRPTLPCYEYIRIKDTVHAAPVVATVNLNENVVADQCDHLLILFNTIAYQLCYVLSTLIDIAKRKLFNNRYIRGVHKECNKPNLNSLSFKENYFELRDSCMNSKC